MHHSPRLALSCIVLSGCNAFVLADNLVETPATSSSDTGLTGGSSASTIEFTTLDTSTASSYGSTSGDSSSTLDIDTSTTAPADPSTSSAGPSGTTEDTAGNTTEAAPPACGTNDSKESLVFVTPHRFYGDLGLEPPGPEVPFDITGFKQATQDKNGRTLANAICQFFADRANFGGDYIAWLSAGPSTDSKPNNIISFLKSSATMNAWNTERHFVRPDGKCVANSWEDWASTGHLVPVNLAPDESPIQGYAWTGSADNGDSTPYHCDRWKTPGPFSPGTAGWLDTNSSGWSSSPPPYPYVAFSCASAFHLYCIQYAD